MAKSTSTGYLRFQELMADYASSHLTPAHEAHKRGETLDRPEADAIFQLVFNGFTEIVNSIDALELTHTLLVCAPPRNKKIKKDEYLKFLIGAYLQEVYILIERLKTYLKKIIRKYVKTSSNSKKYIGLLTAIETTFNPIITARSEHVHSSRYSDSELDLLSSLTLVSRFETKFQFDAQFEYKRVKTNWAKHVKKNNAVTMEFLNIYFDFIYPVITQRGRFIPPITRSRSLALRKKRPK